MPIVIFHGDNQLLMQLKVDEMKKSYPTDAVERVSLKSETFDQLIMRLGTSSFFSDQRLFIVDDADEKKVVVNRIVADPHTTLVLTFAKELPPSSEILKWAESGKFRILNLSQPQDKRIFTFLDLLAEKDVKAFGMVDELLSDFGIVYLLTMLIYLLRRLSLPIGKVPAFVETKMKKQLQKFNENKVIELYEQVLMTEYQFKTGKVEDKTALLLLVNAFVK